MLMLTVGVALVALLLLARARYGSVVTSPVQIVAYGLLAVAALGWLFYDDVAGTRGGAGIRIFLRDGEPNQALLLIATFTLFLLLGANVVGLVVPRRPGHDDLTDLGQIQMPRKLERATLLGAPVPLIAIIAVRGGELWRRPVYLDHAGGSVLVSGASSLSLAVMAALGFLFAKNKARLYVTVVAIGYLAVQFGAGSRRLPLLLVLFALGAFVARPGRATKVGLAVSAAAGLYLLSVPLLLRQEMQHGIAPYWGRLDDVLLSGAPLAVTGLNLLVGFALIQATAYREQPIPTRDMWASVNPLPGGLAGWNEVLAHHRLNFFSPYAGIGELGNAGWAWVIGVALACGAALALLDLAARRHLHAGRQVYALVILGLSALFMLFLTQYTLRSSMRMLYYALAFAIAAEVWLRMTARRERAGGRNAPARAVRRRRPVRG